MDQETKTSASALFSDGTHGGATESLLSSFAMSLTFENVCCDVDLGGGHTRRVLHEVSGRVEAGQMMAILGPSGAGKSTLLDCLARVKNTGVVEGRVLVNGHELDDDRFKRLSGYVYQDDRLMGLLTVSETLRYAAQLRIAGLSGAELQARVRAVIGLLRLDVVKDSLVGNALKRGVSGGEKKRVSIGTTLISNPNLLMLDEPSSGLDSFAAASLLGVLRDIAASGRTLITTIHQPSSRVFRMFDQLLLLSHNGHLLYSGSAADAVPWFCRTYDLVCEAFTNPAEWLLDVAEVGGETAAGAKVTVADLIAGWKQHQEANAGDKAALGVLVADNGPAASGSDPASTAAPAPSGSPLAAGALTLTAETPGATRSAVKTYGTTDGVGGAEVDPEAQLTWLKATVSSRFATGMMTQMRVVTARALRAQLRNPMATYVKVFIAVFFSVMMGSIYYDMPRNQSGIQDRAGVLFFITMNTVFMNMAYVVVFLEDREIFRRERASNLYSTLPFAVARLLQDLPGVVVQMAIQTVIVYYMTGLRTGGLFPFFGITLLTWFAAYCFVLVVSSFAPSTIVANMVTPLTFVMMMLPSGLLINLDNIPAYWLWLKWISIMKYGYAAFMINEFEGTDYHCTAGEYVPVGCVMHPVDPNGPPKCVCPVTSGAQVLHQFGLDTPGSAMWVNVVVLVGMAVGFFSIAVTLLHLLQKEKR